MKIAFGFFIAAGLIMAVMNFEERAPLPLPRAGYMSGIVNGALIIAGGSYWSTGKKFWSERVDLFDPTANAWRSGTPLPEPRSDAACAVVNDVLYIFGGTSGTAARRDALVLDKGSWKSFRGGELPEPRLYPTAVATEGAIYLSEGLSKMTDYHTATASLWALDLGARSGWKQLPPIPGPGRANHAMAALDGKLYIFGGAVPKGKDVDNLSDAYVFDIRSSRWSRLPDLPFARRAWWAVAAGKRILLLGGYTTDFARDVYEYDPNTRTLRPAGNLPHPVCDAKFHVTGSRILGAGGEAGPGVRAPWTFEASVSAPTR